MCMPFSPLIISELLHDIHTMEKCDFLKLVIYLRNRFLLTVICCPVNHWLEVSREVDISQ